MRNSVTKRMRREAFIVSERLRKSSRTEEWIRQHGFNNAPEISRGRDYHPRPSVPKLLELCIKSRSRESERKKSRWCSRMAARQAAREQGRRRRERERKNEESLGRVFTEESGSGSRERRWWGLNKHRESRDRRRCRSSSLTPDNPAASYTHLECSPRPFSPTVSVDVARKE